MMTHTPTRTLLALAVAVALTGAMVGCNSDDEQTQTTTKDDAYYLSQATGLLAQLSTSEKLDLLSGPNTYYGESPTNLVNDVSGVAGYINGILNDETGVNIPALKLADGPAGLRISSSRDGQSGTFYATAWPIGSLLASSWDTALQQEVGEAFGNEVKEYGVDILLAPGMNIQRNPLNGRNFEYYSEDPVLTGHTAAAMVNGIETNGVGTTIKHFFGNNSETNRSSINDIAEPRTWREIYLRGFQIAVTEAQPWALMTSYNKVNGSYVNERRDAVTSILRDEWGFTGLAMSDWFAGDVSNNAHKQVLSGQDLIEPGGVKAQLAAALEAGTLSQSDVDTAALHILTQVLKSPSYQGYAYSNNPDLNSHAALARRAGDESMVLLQNDNNALPIADSNTVATFGVNQIATYKGGTGSGDVNAAYTVNIADGLAERFTVNADLQSFYASYYEANKVYHAGNFGAAGYYTCDESSLSDELTSLITTAASADDVGVISIGRQAGEGADRSAEAGDYYLSDAELALIDQVSTLFKAQGKPVVVVLNVNGVIDTEQWKDKVDGILLAYMGGQETGRQVADLLSGDVNPSGKLAQTFPKSYDDIPSASTFPGEDTDGDGSPDDIYYNEGIYVGYRYFSSFDKAVSFPFGYGLSYTSFSYAGTAVGSNTLDSKGAKGSVTVTTTITNSGSVAGKEVAQVYVSAPEVKLKKPAIELKAYAKTASLVAGSSEQLSFEIPAYILASFSPDDNEWIIEPGTYQVYVSPSADVASTTPVTFSVAKEIVVSSTTAGALALPDGTSAADFVTVSE